MRVEKLGKRGNGREKARKNESEERKYAQDEGSGKNGGKEGEEEREKEGKSKKVP